MIRPTQLATEPQGRLLPFAKMHGAGNDFVVLRGDLLPEEQWSPFAVSACDRRFGIGADGVIAVDKNPKEGFRMRYYNADGTRSVCGNGIRCVSRFIFERDYLTEEQNVFHLETDSGPVAVELVDSGRLIRVNMGAATFAGEEIPCRESGEHILKELEVAGRSWQVTAVGMGNPHCVIFLDSLDGFPIAEIGPEFECHPFFPERTNTEFVEVVDLNTAKMRVWERGVGETLACGTGAAAVFAAGRRIGKLGNRLRLQSPGGEFELEQADDGQSILLSGPAEEVYSGTVDAESLLRQGGRRKI